MKTKFVTLAIALTIASASTSYHLSSLATLTEAQENLIIVLNTITAAGTTALFGLIDDDE